MRTVRVVILSVGIILLFGVIGYTIGMVFLAQSIREEYKIDIDRLEKDTTWEQCDLINGTILAINYDCGRSNCGCTNQCQAPSVLDLDKYNCFTVTIEYQAAYGLVPIEACLSRTHLEKFNVNKDAVDSQKFTLGGLMCGIIGWFMVSSIYMCEIVHHRKELMQK